MDNIDTSESIWKGKVIRYRKWEQRHDRAVDKDLRRAAAKMLAELYVDLSNTAREIVKRAGRETNARFHDVPDFMRDEIVTHIRSSLANYRLKRTDNEPGRVWFQRNEHEPWFDLGYFDNSTGVFSDLPPHPHVVAQNRAIDIERSAFMNPGAGRTADSIKRGVNYMLQAQTSTPFYPPQPDHVHIDMTNTKGTDPMNSDSPEALEAAAAHAMARAAELRALDAREPDGEEPTISWTFTPEHEGAETYTLVAFKATNGEWYATGSRMCRDGMSWRELNNHRMSKNLREGKFLVVAAWAEVGGDE